MPNVWHSLMRTAIIVSAVTNVFLSIIYAIILTLAVVRRKTQQNTIIMLPNNDPMLWTILCVFIISSIVSISSNAIAFNDYSLNDDQTEEVAAEETIVEISGVVDDIYTRGGVTYDSTTEARVILDDKRGDVYCKVNFGQLYIGQEVTVGATEPGKVIYLDYNGYKHYIDYGEQK